MSSTPAGRRCRPALMWASRSARRRSRSRGALEVDRGIGAELVEPMLADDVADGAALGPHDERVRRGTARAITHALHQLAVGDAGSDEEHVVTADEVVGAEDA